MAEYSIVLNLGGNAVSQAEKLARALDMADKNANQLAARLSMVKSVLTGMPVVRVPFSQSYGYGGYSSRPYAGGRPRSQYQRERDVNYTRHRSTRIASWGTGFNIGGFSGRLSTIIQPDVNGQILGMDAAKLMKGVNVASIATGIVTAVGKAVVKAVAGGTLVQYGAGAGVNAVFNRLLMSSGMTEGIRISQRRRQAQLGLGAGYAQAMAYADELAENYGLERSAALSSLNVMTGLRVGSGNERLSMATSAALTRVGGLISQQSGASFERVMTNIQQLMTQSNPNIRDIRELLNQAPILGRYALDEMEKQGVTGVDKNTWLKDQANILSVLQRYDIENASSTIMQARGMVTRSRQDFYARIAENPNWLTVAGNTSNLMDAAANAVSNLLTAFSESQGLQNSVNSLVALIDTVGNNADGIGRLLDKTTSFISHVLGVNIADTEAAGREAAQRRSTVRYTAQRLEDEAFNAYLAAGLVTSANPDVQRRSFEEFYQKFIETNTRKGLAENVSFIGQEYVNQNLGLIRYAHGERLQAPYKGDSSYFVPSMGGPTFRYAPFSSRNPFSNFIAGQNFDYYAPVSHLPSEAFMGAFSAALEEAKNAPKIVGGQSSTAAMGADISGFNKDRRSLEIHFHDAIVEWNSTITTNDPQEIVNEVAENIEGAASRAIQIALLGASQKMDTNWY